jgi:type I restriction enzyme S subunit
VSVWIQQLPAGWSEAPLKTRLARNDGGVWGSDPDGGSDTVVLRSTEQKVDGSWAIDEPAKRKLSPIEIASSLLEVGDLLVTKSSGSELHIGKTSLVSKEVSDLRACYSNFMQRLRLDDRTEPRYVHYWLNNELCREQFAYLSNSTSGLANLSAGLINEVTLAFPAKGHQERIANFLDDKTSRIDALIAEKERLISALDEWRAAELTRICFGQDSTLIETGNHWIPLLPLGWGLKRLKHLVTGIEQGWSPECEARLAGEDEWGVLKAGAANGGSFREAEHKTLPGHIAPIPALEVKVGDVLATRASGTADYVGSVSYVYSTRSKLMLSDKNFRFKFDSAPPLMPELLAWMCNTRPLREQILQFVGGADGLAKNIGSGNLREVWLAVPPGDQQADIVKLLQVRNAQLDDLKLHLDEHIARLREYRSSLISAAVTGQLDVGAYEVMA